MNESITRENLAYYLSTFFDNNELLIKKVAKAVGCSIATIKRIVAKETFPTDEMLKQCAILIAIGYEKYKKLSRADKEKITESIGAIGGGVLGFGAISAAISSSGTIIGVSAAGITSGLSAIGSLVGGGMLAGATTIAAVPIIVGIAGYGLIKGIKETISYYKANDKKINEYWEVYPEHFNEN